MKWSEMSSEDVKLVSDFETITTFCMYGCTEVKDSNGFCRAVEFFVALLSEYYWRWGKRQLGDIVDNLVAF